jgi:hypothetical protein
VRKNLQCKNVRCGKRKKQEVTQSTAAGELKVIFLEEDILSKWCEQEAFHNESTSSKFVPK